MHFLAWNKTVNTQQRRRVTQSRGVSKSLFCPSGIVRGYVRCRPSLLKVSSAIPHALEQPFPPTLFHGVSKFKLGNVSDRSVYGNLEHTDIGEADAPQLLLDPRKQKKIGRGQIRRIGWVWHKLDVVVLAESPDHA